MIAKPVPIGTLAQLNDVTITTPDADQSLAYDGTRWVNKSMGAVSAGAGVAYYLDTTVSAGANETLKRIPSGAAESIDTGIANNNTVFISRYVSDTVLGGTQIDAGTWDFNTYTKVDSAAGVTSIVQRINKRVEKTGTIAITGTGTSRTATVTGATPFVSGDANADITLATLIETPNGTFWITAFTSTSVVTVTIPSGYANESGVAYSMYYYLFKTSTPTITNTTVALITTKTVQTAFTGITATDKLVAAYFVTTTANQNITASLYYNGTAHYSHIETPLITRHNDLAGLQGGATSEYYHLTSAQNTAVGSLGTMSTQAANNVAITGGTITGATVSGETLTSLATGFSIAGGTTSRTLTVDETISISAKAPLNSPSFTTPNLGVATSSNLTMSGSIWEAEGANVASASSCNIWATDGNTRHITGTTAINDFATAPQPGAWMRCIADAAFTLTHSATIDLPGQADIVTVAGDTFEVYAETTTTFKVRNYTRATGDAIVETKYDYFLNGCWHIDQTKEGGLHTSGGGAQAMDGLKITSTGAGIFKTRRLTDPENAAKKCCEITCTTEDTDPTTSGDVYLLDFALEGSHVANLAFGTAEAKTITLKFKFKTNLTGIYGVSFHNSNVTWNYATTINVTSTSETEYSLTIPGATTGTWLYGNGTIGLKIRFCLASAAAYQGTTGVWSASNILSSTSQCNFMSSAANIAFLKEIHLIEGLAGHIMPQSFAEALQRCQRFYAKSFPIGTAVAQNSGVNGAERLILTVAGAATNFFTSTLFPVPMAIPPTTLTTYNPSAANAEARNLNTSADCSVTVFAANSERAGLISLIGDAGGAVGHRVLIHWTVSCIL